jgi:hypothetical protein
MLMCDVEEWRPVVSHPTLYEVSSLGRVRIRGRWLRRGFLNFYHRPRVLATAVGGRARNYLRVRLHNPERFAFVHALVAEAFIGPRPDGAVILHTNDDGFDNRAAHLRYGDRDENEADRHVARVAPHLEPAPF